MAISTIGLWLATNKLWAAGEKQFGLLSESAAAQSRDMQSSIRVAQDAGKAAARSADLAERTMVLNDRPWISVTANLIGPLIFTEEGCSIDIRVVLQNVGRSPAIKASAFVELVSSNSVVERHIKQVDVASLTLEASALGQTLFPNNTRVTERTYRMKRDAIEAAVREDENHQFRPCITICGYYGLPTGGRFRHTSAVYEIVLALEPDKSFDTTVGQISESDIELLNLSIGTTT